MPTTAESIATSLGVLLLRRFRSTIYDELVDGVDDAITTATYPVLSGVARIGPVRVATLGSEIGLDRSIVSRRAAQLQKAGLLQSSADPAERRATLLSLTPTGEQAVAIMRQRLVAVIDRHLDSWPAADRRCFARLFDRFVWAESSDTG